MSDQQTAHHSSRSAMFSLHFIHNFLHKHLSLTPSDQLKYRSKGFASESKSSNIRAGCISCPSGVCNRQATQVSMAWSRNEIVTYPLKKIQ